MRVLYKLLPQHPYNLWPILDIRLRNKDKVIDEPVLALVDSGSSISILNQELAETLGFGKDKLGGWTGGGETVSGHYESVAIPGTIDTTIAGVAFPVKFTVINNRSLIWSCILGEDSIFQIARIDFWKFKGYFDVELRKDLN